ncbi:hypothetical protein EGW08_001863, partial [Elysia chlorotica]
QVLQLRRLRQPHRAQVSPRAAPQALPQLQVHRPPDRRLPRQRLGLPAPSPARALGLDAAAAATAAATTTAAAAAQARQQRQPRERLRRRVWPAWAGRAASRMTSEPVSSQVTWGRAGDQASGTESVLGNGRESNSGCYNTKHTNTCHNLTQAATTPNTQTRATI